MAVQLLAGAKLIELIRASRKSVCCSGRSEAGWDGLDAWRGHVLRDEWHVRCINWHPASGPESLRVSCLHPNVCVSRFPPFGPLHPNVCVSRFPPFGPRIEKPMSPAAEPASTVSGSRGSEASASSPGGLAQAPAGPEGPALTRRRSAVSPPVVGHALHKVRSGGGRRGQPAGSRNAFQWALIAGSEPG